MNATGGLLKGYAGATFTEDGAAVLERAKQVADWAGFPARKAEAAKRGKRLGRGMAYYVEIAGGGGTEAHAAVSRARPAHAYRLPMPMGRRPIRSSSGFRTGPPARAASAAR